MTGLSAEFLFEMLDNSRLKVTLPTNGRDLHASITALQWVTGAHAVVFGGMMLVFGAIAGLVLTVVAAARAAGRTHGMRLRRAETECYFPCLLGAIP